MKNVFIVLLAIVAALDQNETRVSGVCLLNTIGSGANLKPDEVCQWDGVNCHRGIVWKVSWRRGYEKVKSLDWLPPSLRKVRFEYRTHSKELETRRLPRMLKFCWIVFCNIHGTVDLRALPESLNVLNLKGNRIGGTIILKELPHHMRFISLYISEIQEVIVCNQSLPGSLVEVNIKARTSTTNFVSSDGSAVDRRVGQFRATRDDVFENEYEGW